MWVLLNDAMLSIVQKPDQPEGTLTVRARAKGDITAAFPNANERTTPDGDYAFRAVIDRAVVAQVLADRVWALDYPNFKNTIKDHGRHSAYLRVWGVLAAWQESLRHRVASCKAPRTRIRRRGPRDVK